MSLVFVLLIAASRVVVGDVAADTMLLSYFSDARVFMISLVEAAINQRYDELLVQFKRM
jgi:hypothetical protein